MLNKFCRFFHINNGQCECWRLYIAYKHRDLIRACICDGEERRCDFEKVGAKCSSTS